MALPSQNDCWSFLGKHMCSGDWGDAEWAAGGQPAGSPPEQQLPEQVPGLPPRPSHRLGQGMDLLQALLIGLLVLLVRLDHYHAGGALGACGCTQVRL